MPKSRRSTIVAQNNTATQATSTLSERVSNRIEQANSVDSIVDMLGSIGNLANASISNDYGTIMSEQQILDACEEQIRERLHQGYEDDGFFYTENEQDFLEMMENAHNEVINYEYENVLNGSTNSFGIEIEFVNGNANEIARELYDLGICGHPERLPYHSRVDVAGKWKLERDGSVSVGDRGGELVSPPLLDTPETWQNIEKICEVAKNYGAEVSDRTGLHIHQHISPLDTARQRWNRLFRTIGGFEPVIYRTAGGDSGIVRSGVNSYATPFELNAIRGVNQNMALENDAHLNRITRLVSQGDRYQGVNLTNIYQENRPNTVELRYFNSSLTPSTIQASVKMANGIMFASNKARIGGTSDSENMKKRGRILLAQRMGRNDTTNHEGVKKFVDIIFTRKKDKDAVLKLYAKNRWRA